jgi:hypothetical protein|tara:strand:+ start:65 stop:484 length:420 start_codon:yes stop_codon:yes gene_type:complete
METPLEGNTFSKAMADNDGNYEAAKKQLAGSPTQMNGMMQPNQIQQTPINPQLLTKGFNPQVLTGTPQPGVSYNNLMPNPSAPLNQNQQTFGILNAKNSKEAGISEAKRLAAQKKAREERDKKKKEDKKKKDPVSGNKK